MKLINVVVPCYFNEQSIAPLFSELLAIKEQLVQKNVQLLVTCVDDGSEDDTWKKLQEQQHANSDWVHIIKLIRNFGAQYAVLAGFNCGKTADAYICLAADLQDPPHLIIEMVDYWLKGIPLVVANRSENEDGKINSSTSKLFHKTLQRIAFPNAPKGGFDLVLIDRKIQEHLVNSNEKNTHIFYWIFSLGYPFVAIPYKRVAREDGTKGKWTFSKKIKLFSDTLTSFTSKPLRWITMLGLSLGLLLFLYGIVIVILKLTGTIKIQGWTATMFVISFFGAFQLIALGVIGEYIWRILEQVRNKPMFIVEKEIKQI